MTEVNYFLKSKYVPSAILQLFNQSLYNRYDQGFDDDDNLLADGQIIAYLVVANYHL
jgi:hypothetical protein